METKIWRGSTCWIWFISWSKDGERLMGGDFHLGHGKRDFWNGKKITPKAIGLFKRFFKRNFPNEKHLVLSPNKMEKPPRPKIKSWVNPNKTFVIKKVFEIFSFKDNPMAYGVILPLSKIISCHDLGWNPLPKAISHLCVKIYFKSSKLNLPMIFLPFISYQK